MEWDGGMMERGGRGALSRERVMEQQVREGGARESCRAQRGGKRGRLVEGGPETDS